MLVRSILRSRRRRRRNNRSRQSTRPSNPVNRVINRVPIIGPIRRNATAPARIEKIRKDRDKRKKALAKTTAVSSTRSKNVPTKKQREQINERRKLTRSLVRDQDCIPRPDAKKAGEISALVRAGKRGQKTQWQKNINFQKWC